MRRNQLLEVILGDLAALKRLLVSHTHHLAHHSKITPTQSVILGIIHQHSGMGIKDISQILGMTSSAATQLVDGLVENGLLIRESSQDDRRAIKLSLSKECEKQLQSMKKEGADRIKKIFEVLSDEELETYAELNHKIAQGVLNKKCECIKE